MVAVNRQQPVRLSVEQVSYAVSPQRFLLRNVSFRLEAGETLGLIGPSGSGKTTLAHVIMGIWKPAGGIVRLDGADVYTWPREQFGAHVGYMPQDVELFGGSVRDNIARLAPDATDDAVIAAAQLAHAHEMILKLPQGYRTDIGEGGAWLSAGQRQRIGLARAFYGQPKLLVLDEPDSNLDDAGQAAFAAALRQAHHARMTVIVITHRASVLNHADKILFLRDGMAEAFGPAREILGRLAASLPSRMRSMEHA
jgi:ABC-type protease/lipase transport system fused ATPase/permease subunit